MKFKTVNWNTGSAAARFRSTRKKIEENRKKNKAASLQAGGPALKESGCKQVDSLQAIGYYKIMNEAKRYKKMIAILTSKKFQKNFMKLCAKKKPKK